MRKLSGFSAIVFFPLVWTGSFVTEGLAENAPETPPITNDYSPMWSPDGKQIVFSSTRSGNFQIYVMNADGSDVRRLTDRDGYDGDPSWSPDGTKIAFCSDRDGNREIYVMDPDGGNPVNLTNHPASDCETPSWSPDGTQLTFVSTRDGDWKNSPEDNYEVYVMNADGSGQRRLSNLVGYDLTSGQAWTPDGRQIVFCSSGDHLWAKKHTEGFNSENFATFDIYRIDLDGTNLTRLTFTKEEDSYPFVSPDGQLISYSRYLTESGTRYDIYVMTADGKTVNQITAGPYFEFTAAWSPNGKKIVYPATDSQGTSSIYVANADGTNPVKLTNKESK